MKRLIIISCLLLPTTILVGCSRSHDAAQATLSKTVIIDAAGRESFAPAPADSKPALTADQAISMFEGEDPDFKLPSDATVQLGLYTAAVGDGTFRFNDALAYGLNFHLCIAPQHEVASNVQLSCDFWLFLDANTGHMLEGEEATAPTTAG